MLSTAKIKVLRAAKKYSESVGVKNHPRLRSTLSLMARRCFPEIYDGKELSITARIDGVRIAVPNRFWSHYLLHDYEPVTRRTLAKTVRPGMTIIDVGAHIGLYSLLSSKAVTQCGVIHAIEPGGSNLDYLSTNIELNKMRNIVVLSRLTK